jgi:hypothetical protein
MLFVKWKKENSDFDMMLTRVESDMADDGNFNDNSVNLF